MSDTGGTAALIPWVAGTMAFVLGTVIGSFLNACIYRLPRNLSLLNPRRSFCPTCDRQIPWYENLPILSWLLLRGRCSECHEKISPRYLVVELLTGLVFLTIWRWYDFPLAIPYWVLASLLIAGTFIDIEHLIIPDEITWGGTGAGVLLSLIFPLMMGTSSHLQALGLSFLGAAAGFGLLWLVVEGGKLAFGKKRIRLPEAADFVWRRDGERADIDIGDDRLTWEELFSRESDRLDLQVTNVTVDGQSIPDGDISLTYNELHLADRTTRKLDHLQEIRGRVEHVSIPREAMGFGDGKFLAALGAFLGRQAVIFTIFAASIIGSLAALGGVLLSRDRSGTKLPFGPFLAIGAGWWVLGGDRLFEWYFSIFSFPEG